MYTTKQLEEKRDSMKKLSELKRLKSLELEVLSFQLEIQAAKSVIKETDETDEMCRSVSRIRKAEEKIYQLSDTIEFLRNGTIPKSCTGWT